MEGLNAKTYLETTRKRFDPFSLVLSIVGLAAVIFAASNFSSPKSLFDIRSMLIVLVGTTACVLFQYDFRSFFLTGRFVLRTFVGTPHERIVLTINQLNEAIVDNVQITTLRPGKEIDGDLLNDIIHMYNQGLLFEEIDEFIASRISEEFLSRHTAVSMLRRASVIAPALGLLGTVIGLVGVLRSLNDPSQIGPSMALALMTTAYGAGLGSLVLTPLAGRVEHHNTIYLENHKRLMSKVSVLLTREERQMDIAHVPRSDEQ